jgi:hypothetical protein
MDITDLMQQAENEMGALQSQMIERAVQKAIGQLKITENNLDNNLIELIMSAKSGGLGGQPIPERKEIPSSMESLCEDPILINRMVSEIVNDLYVGNNVYIYGKAGSGKSYMAANIAKFLGLRLYQINCSQWTSPIQIIGGQTINGYEQGSLIKAWQNGGILLLDELPKLDPNTAGLLNEALAKTADIVKSCNITKEAYDDLLIKMGSERSASVELIKKDGKYYRYDYPTITDGKGDQIRMAYDEKIRDGKTAYIPKFFVIATGNTNLKDVGAQYSGNNRQDYSLVDRFAGSFYQVDFDEKLERSMIYKRVFEVSKAIRDFLVSKSAIESISLRTMLNFNRIYEQEFLRKIESKYATDVVTYAEVGGDKLGGKTFKESVMSFLNTLNEQNRNELIPTVQGYLSDDTDVTDFISEFEGFHGYSPL